MTRHLATLIGLHLPFSQPAYLLCSQPDAMIASGGFHPYILSELTHRLEVYKRAQLTL